MFICINKVQMLKLVKMKHTVTGTTLEIFYISEDI